MRWKSTIAALALSSLCSTSAWGQSEPAGPASPSGEAGAVAGATWEAELGVGRDWLSGDLEGWEEYLLRLRASFPRALHLRGTARQAERFGAVDRELSVGGGVGLSRGWTADAELSWSPTGRVLPRRGAAGSVHRALGAGWGVRAGGWLRAYETTDVFAGQLTAERYWRDFRGAYTLSLARVEGGASAATHLLQANYHYADGGVVTLVGSAGREAEVLDPGRVEVTPVRAGALWGVHWLASRTALTYAVGIHDQGAVYTRAHLQLGIRQRF